MAYFAGRTLHTDGSYSILIDPSKDRDASGRVEFGPNQELAWSSPTGRDVWINIGHHREGTIHELGYPPVRFSLPSPNIQ